MNMLETIHHLRELAGDQYINSRGEGYQGTAHSRAIYDAVNALTNLYLDMDDRFCTKVKE